MAFRPSSTFQITFHADNLRVYNRELFDAIEAEGQKLEGHCTVQLKPLSEEVRVAILNALPLLAKMLPPDPLRENAEYNRIQIEAGTRAAKQRKLAEEADATVAAYERMGLQRTEKNKEQILEHIQKNSGIYCKPSVEYAVVELKRLGNLDWVDPKPATPPPAPPPESLAILSDGSRQIPLGATPNRSHTITQLRDLDQRERAVRGRGGWHGAKF
jgi:hypothetical protein